MLEQVMPIKKTSHESTSQFFTPCLYDPNPYTSQSHLVNLDNIELVTTMCALVHFVHHSTTLNDSMEPWMMNAAGRTRELSKPYVEIAETLIMRLQDALDEEQIRALSDRSCLAPTQAEMVNSSVPTAVIARKDDAPAAVQAAIVNVAELSSISGGGGGLIQTTSG